MPSRRRNSPYFITQPSSQTVTNGTSLTFSATVGGQPPLNYQWLFNGTNLPAGGNVSGTTSNVLSITAATTNNAGNYQLVATNSYGSVTSSVAVLTVGFAPAFSAEPTNLTLFSGGNAVFSATVGGSPPFIYQWRENGTNLVNGGGLSGATSNVLTFTAVTTNSSGNYNLFVSNNFGMSTSSVATLTVVFPPTIITGIAANNDGSVTLNLGGAPGYTYVLETTTNLVSPVSWSPVATNTFDTNGIWQFTDTQATNFTQQFYRLELAP